ncbi:MAG: hypothetical protein FWE28_08720 [Oscillospiraceae bacterium]|nr:hypothetical protein [Oscillospiraceae bacterium]
MFEKEILEGFRAQYKCALLSKLKTTDGSYRKLLEERTRCSVDVLTLTQGDATLNQLVQGYIDSVNDVHDKETDVLYLQGVKDCLGVLKLLGAL